MGIGQFEIRAFDWLNASAGLIKLEGDFFKEHFVLKSFLEICPRFFVEIF